MLDGIFQTQAFFLIKEVLYSRSFPWILNCLLVLYICVDKSEKIRLFFRAIVSYLRRLSDFLEDKGFNKWKQRWLEHKKRVEKDKRFEEYKMFSRLSFPIALLVVVIYTIMPEVFSLQEAKPLIAPLLVGFLFVLIIVYLILIFLFPNISKHASLWFLLMAIIYWYSRVGFGWKVVLILLSLVIILSYPYFLFGQNVPTTCFMITLIVMLLVFLIGLFVISALFLGSEKLEKDYLASGDRSDFFLKCGVSGAKEIYIGSMVSCSINNDLNIVQANVSYTDFYGSGKRHSLNTSFEHNKFYFVAPSDCSSLHFDILVMDEDNQTLSLSPGTIDHTFYSYEETQQRKKDFLWYFFALLGIVFFTVPSMMLNFNQLLERRLKRK